MSGETVAQRVWMYGLRKACSLGGFLTGVPDGLGIDGLITAMVTVAWKEPDAGFSPQAVPVLAQFFEQLGAEHDIAISAAFSTPDVNHHALAVNVADLQARQFGTPHAGGIERHE